MTPKKHHASRKISWNPISGGITAAQGYLAAGVAAGIKKKGLDLAVLFSSQLAAAAGVFTLNRVQAAPVVLSKENLKASRGRIRAVVINSGCANACTGKQGLRDAAITVSHLASLLEIDPPQVLVGSTGVIGAPLPVRKVLNGISSAVAALNSKGGTAAVRAIMTTDTREKTFAVEGRLGGKKVRIGGMAKGAGMIHPNMATMISVVTTDIQATPAELNRMLHNVVERTFNCLTVDGDTSTNDMVLLLANGTSGCRLDARSRPQFERGLEAVCQQLAMSIARDGEGATKFVEIRVREAASFENARRVAKAIANSPLVKTAICGEEFNWGRIICAAGYSGVPFDPDRVAMSLNGIPAFRNGAPVASARGRAEKAMKAHDIKIEVRLGAGKAEAKVWTCDFSHGYVDINASYIS
jgi:glutamate N-acetyltransferase/amino-acid N-acetyltransferase